LEFETWGLEFANKMSQFSPLAVMFNGVYLQTLRTLRNHCIFSGK